MDCQPPAEATEGNELSKMPWSAATDLEALLECGHPGERRQQRKGLLNSTQNQKGPGFPRPFHVYRSGALSDPCRRLRERIPKST